MAGRSKTKDKIDLNYNVLCCYHLASELGQQSYDKYFPLRIASHPLLRDIPINLTYNDVPMADG